MIAGIGLVVIGVLVSVTKVEGAAINNDPSDGGPVTTNELGS